MPPLSVLKKNWLLRNTDQALDLKSKLLHNRNLKTPEEIDLFFNPNIKNGLHDSSLMPHMKKAVARIMAAIERKERIVVFGDYDVDGITGTAILIHTLRKVGAEVSYRLPHRVDDGYGLSDKFIAEFIGLNVKLLITVDNGISGFDEVELANKNGIDVIITDHHTIPEKIPDAYAILHPKLPEGYPFDGLTGAGVAFKLAKALFEKLLPEDQQDDAILPLLDLACMGTIADLGPMRGENRVIVKHGLRFLEQTRWPGLSRLKEFAGLKGKMDTRSVGFSIGPRINAAGRMSHPYFALQLLLDDGTKSHELAANLEDLNSQRQNLMSDVLNEALAMAEEQAAHDEKIIVIFGKSWHSGIVGLIASKLVESFHRPAFVMEDRGEILVGSARSIDGFNVTSALKSSSKFLNEFGGHAAAAGFEVAQKNLPAFVEALREAAGTALHGKTPVPSLMLECELSAQEISLATADLLAEFEPFGIDNETPRFLVRNIIPSNPTFVGATKKHLKFTGEMDGQTIDCIGFNASELAQHLALEPIDLACELMKDEFRGRSKLTLKILDFRPAQVGAA